MAKPLQHQVILRALEIISDESRWTVAAVARDQDGGLCPVTAPEAVRFCAVGALERAAFELLGDGVEPLLLADIEKAVLGANGARLSLAQINDHLGREAVVELFKKTIAA
jgi:hypothetical protein